MKQIEKEQEAYRLGQIAYKENRPCVPCLDPQLMALLTGLEPGQGASKIMQAWSNAYRTLLLAE
jgi:hypothetical protein